MKKAILVRSFSDAEIKRDLIAVEKAYLQQHNPRHRADIYFFLAAVHELARKWSGPGRRAIKCTIMKLFDIPGTPGAKNLIKLIVDVTCPADAKGRWKYVRALRYARQWKVRPSEVAEWIKKQGGINSCVEQYRDSKKHVKKDIEPNYSVSRTPQAKVPVRLVASSTAQANHGAPPRTPPPLPAKIESGRSRDAIFKDLSFAPWWVVARQSKAD